VSPTDLPSRLVSQTQSRNDGILAIDVPQLCVTLTPSTPWDWNYTTIPQAGLENRVVPFPRGIGLGGTSAVSACSYPYGPLRQLIDRFFFVDCLVYTRGTKSDIDTWAALSGDESWSWDKMLPYFKKVCVRLNLFAKMLTAAIEREVQLPRRWSQYFWPI
jgi:choline dehydrogenase-like flavoprotein